MRIKNSDEYTDKTREYIMEFQKDMGLVVDGLAGNQTIIKLEEFIKWLNGLG